MIDFTTKIYITLITSSCVPITFGRELYNMLVPYYRMDRCDHISDLSRFKDHYLFGLTLLWQPKGHIFSVCWLGHHHHPINIIIIYCRSGSGWAVIGG